MMSQHPMFSKRIVLLELCFVVSILGALLPVGRPCPELDKNGMEDNK
jgi:hypothetical protein